MKFRYCIVFLICMIFIPNPVYAMNFDPEVLYNSVMVVYTKSSVGSGFAINENTIITNAHVVENSRDVTIKLYSNKSITGKVVKKDKDRDLALIEVEEELTPLNFNTDENLAIGTEVYAIGAPKDIPYTMTKGIISAKNRKIGNYNYIQIDASINAGNSGGPLVNENGEVIGINTMKMTDAEGIGFAIGTSYINNFINDDEDDLEDDDSKDVSSIDSYEDGESIEVKYKEVVAQNEKLKIAVIILSIALIILILIMLKQNIKRKKNDKNDFEIEFYD